VKVGVKRGRAGGVHVRVCREKTDGGEQNEFRGLLVFGIKITE
jgi:hypothetical protein